MSAIRGPVEETGNPRHAPRLMIPCENNVPESARYSLLHLGRGVMLDHILVSRALLRFFTGLKRAFPHGAARFVPSQLPSEPGAARGVPIQ